MRTSEIGLCLKNSLFRGIKEAELLPLLACLQAEQRSYEKGAHLFLVGDPAGRMGLVLSGRVDTVYEDTFGGRSIIGSFEAGRLFCDAFAASDLHELPVNVVAHTQSTVLLMDMTRILSPCDQGCAIHQSLAHNLIRILANKYVDISRKMLHLSGRFTKQKLLSYLSEQMRQAHGKPFAVPMNRHELADYLFVDRTGLSAEWNKLKRMGILLEEDGLFSLKASPCVAEEQIECPRTRDGCNRPVSFTKHC